MGSSESKPASTHVWKASGPNGVSQDLVDSLQSSHETDASRARTVELQIQARVASELHKLQQEQSDALARAHEMLAADPSSSSSSSSSSPPSGRSSQAVSDEIAALRRQLEDRRKVRELPKDVAAARGEVIRCLRENDRRPLDCWEEVQRFKAEVKKLEDGWVSGDVAR